MTPAEIVSEIVTILTSGITTFAQALGGGISQFAQSLAFTGTGENQTLSIYFVLVLVFAGVSLVISLTRRIFDWLSTLGGSN